MTPPDPPDAVSSAFLRTLRARKPLLRFLDAFCRTVCGAGGRAFIVGGFVRDVIGGRPGKDIDLVAAGIGGEALGALLRALPARALGVRRVFRVGRAFPVYKVKTTWETDDIDVATARGASARDDAGCRDFTINAMMFRLDPIGDRLSGAVVDFFGGLEDLRRGTIRAVGNPADRIREDPLRILRAIRLGCERPGYTVERATWRAMVAAVPGLTAAVSADRIAGELLRSLAADPGKAVEEMHRAGLLHALLPEIPDWETGPLERTLRRYRALEKALGTPLPQTALLANLLAEAAVEECDRIVERGADARGARTDDRRTAKPFDRMEFALPGAAAAARRLRLPHLRDVTRMLEDVARLRHAVRLRNRFAQIESLMTRSETPGQTLALYAAVQRASGRRPANVGALLERAAARPPLLSGPRLLELGVPAGPSIDAILEDVRDATLAGRVATRNEAERLALALYRKRWNKP